MWIIQRVKSLSLLGRRKPRELEVEWGVGEGGGGGFGYFVTCHRQEGGGKANPSCGQQHQQATTSTSTKKKKVLQQLPDGKRPSLINAPIQPREEVNKNEETYYFQIITRKEKDRWKGGGGEGQHRKCLPQSLYRSFCLGLCFSWKLHFLKDFWGFLRILEDSWGFFGGWPFPFHFSCAGGKRSCAPGDPATRFIWMPMGHGVIPFIHSRSKWSKDKEKDEETAISKQRLTSTAIRLYKDQRLDSSRVHKTQRKGWWWRPIAGATP